jgi:hypothetical protein
MNKQQQPIGQHDLSTSAGGRAFLAEFFATHLRRHDFQRYIEERLAADFACALAGYLSENVAAIAAGGAQEPIYQVMVGEKWVDSTAAEYAAVSNEKRIVCAAPLPRVAATVAPEVIAWRDAYQAYVDATAQYNSHLEYVRAHCPFGTSVDAQYQAMNEAQRKAFALLKPMHAALMADASTGAPK